VPSYRVENFGCRATQADGAALERQLDACGFSRAFSEQAELVILNTCTVTSSADQDARAAIRRVQRENRLARIVVTGCYAQRAPGEVAALPGVWLVVGNSHKHQLAEIVQRNFRDAEKVAAGNETVEPASPGAGASREAHSLLPIANLTENWDLRTESWEKRTENPTYVSDIFAHTELLAAPVFESASPIANQHDRTRPNLKVQDGCDNRCAFCVIPSVRGHSRSLPLGRVISEVNMLVAAGYRELVISGINLGRWGRDLADAAQPGSTGRHHGQRLESLIRAILAETQLEKLRISSVEPTDWSDELIALVASTPRIAKHAHVPLQSGSDAVLRRMHRKYRPWHYREKIETIRAAMPAAAIGADVMVGFPGESDLEFEATRSLIADLPFTYLHVFTYSARPGTPAASMPNQIPPQIARQRSKILRDLAVEKKKTFMQSFFGRKLDAITLNVVHERPDGQFTEALTDNYQKTYIKGRHTPNRWLTVRVDAIEDGAFLSTHAEIIDPLKSVADRRDRVRAPAHQDSPGVAAVL